MGSITKPVKPPVVTQVVQTQPATTTTVTEPTIETPNEEEQQSEARRESLLRRSRGRSGTVLTSLGGFLTPSSASNDSARKTLLGE